MELLIYIVLTISALLGSMKIISCFDKRSQNKYRLYNLNALYECTNEECKKYHRKYQEIIKEKSDENYQKIKPRKNACPHCNHYISTSVDEEFEWTKYHIDCPKLDKNKYKTYIEALEDINKTAYEMRSIDKFIEKNNL